jgi:hypothetical protein
LKLASKPIHAKGAIGSAREFFEPWTYRLHAAVDMANNLLVNPGLDIPVMHLTPSG